MVCYKVNRLAACGGWGRREGPVKNWPNIFGINSTRGNLLLFRCQFAPYFHRICSIATVCPKVNHWFLRGVGMFFLAFLGGKEKKRKDGAGDSAKKEYGDKANETRNRRNRVTSARLKTSFLCNVSCVFVDYFPKSFLWALRLVKSKPIFKY